MKTIIKLIFLLVFINSWSQSINYKALIKDGGGNVVASSLVTVQFQILQGTGMTNVYQETHTPTTDTNGIIIVNIGEGTPVSGVFADINWGVDDHYLNVQINTGSGLTDMGTTQFKAVPYALSAANVSGLEAIDEGNGVGWRLISRDPLKYGNIGFNATDISYNSQGSETWGATGSASFAMGARTTASGLVTLATGSGSIASGEHSTAMGSETAASGRYSTAMGYKTKAIANSSLAIGYYNIGGGDPIFPIGTDPLFEIGNGTYSDPSNALTVLKNGTITAPSLTNTLIETAGDKALITKEYLDLNASTGLETIDEGNGIGWRLKGRDPLNYGNIGDNAVDLSNSISSSSTNGATGSNSTAMGQYTKAYGSNSTAMGYGALASGEYSTAMGRSTIASGANSTAMGLVSSASGLYTTAMGVNTSAEAYSSTALGYYNIGGGNPTTWVDTDPLFEIGNGERVNPSNALTVLKNGNVGIDTPNPSVKLHITGGSDAGLNQTGGYIVLGETTGMHMVIDDNEIMVKNNGVGQTLWLNQGGGAVAVGGVLVHSSDRRLKKDIATLSYGLSDILKMNPVEYNWKNREQKHKSIGLIAQELQPIIANIVRVGEDKEKTLSVSYTELIPVLIKAIKEQQTIIESQKKESVSQNKTIESLLQRMSALEGINNK